MNPFVSEFHRDAVDEHHGRVLQSGGVGGRGVDADEFDRFTVGGRLKKGFSVEINLSDPRQQLFVRELPAALEQPVVQPPKRLHPARDAGRLRLHGRTNF